MEAIFQIVVFLVLLFVGLIFGRIAEKRHYKRIAEREAALKHILVFTEKTPPAKLPIAHAQLVRGSVVVGEDYFKRVAAMLKSLVGGRLTAYESIMDRGRREAIIRMKEQAEQMGAKMVFNVRLETFSVNDSAAPKQGMFAAEFMAYGTALVMRKV